MVAANGRRMIFTWWRQRSPQLAVGRGLASPLHTAAQSPSRPVSGEQRIRQEFNTTVAILRIRARCACRRAFYIIISDQDLVLRFDIDREGQCKFWYVSGFSYKVEWMADSEECVTACLIERGLHRAVLQCSVRRTTVGIIAAQKIWFDASIK